MEKVDFLPLGSIVYLKDGNKKVVIVARGLLVRSGDKFVFFDYGGVPYPEGIQGDKMAYFQHHSVEKVIFEGFKDYDDEMTVAKINSYIEKHPDIERGDVNSWQANIATGN